MSCFFELLIEKLLVSCSIPASVSKCCFSYENCGILLGQWLISTLIFLPSVLPALPPPFFSPSTYAFDIFPPAPRALLSSPEIHMSPLTPLQKQLICLLRCNFCFDFRCHLHLHILETNFLHFPCQKQTRFFFFAPSFAILLNQGSMCAHLTCQ